MNLKWPELRAELVESLDETVTLAHDVRAFADTRREWQDDEDDCLLAAHSQVLKAQEAIEKVRDILMEVP